MAHKTTPAQNNALLMVALNAAEEKTCVQIHCKMSTAGVCGTRSVISTWMTGASPLLGCSNCLRLGGGSFNLSSMIGSQSAEIAHGRWKG
jgi:hypothetical protein